MTVLALVKVKLLTLDASFAALRRKSLQGLLISSVCLSLPLRSEVMPQFEDLETIRSEAQDFALAQIDEQKFTQISGVAIPLDARLQLHKCEPPLQAFSTSASFNITRITVGIRCTGTKPWTLYVPVTIDATVEVLKTRQQFNRGELLQNTGVEIISLPLSKLPTNYINDISQINQMEFTRNVKPDTILTLSHLKIRQIIQRGQEVVIEAKGSGVQVRMNGEALASGSIGDLIPVRNQNSGRQIQAVILNEQTVGVNL